MIHSQTAVIRLENCGWGLILVLVLFGSLSISVMPVSGSNILREHGFEGGSLQGWGVTTYYGGAVSVICNSSIEGECLVLMEQDPAGSGMGGVPAIYQSFPNSTVYSLSFWAKLVRPGTSTWLPTIALMSRINQSQAIPWDWRDKLFLAGITLRATDEWTRLTWEFEPPLIGVEAFLLILDGAYDNAVVAFDDFSLDGDVLPPPLVSGPPQVFTLQPGGKISSYFTVRNNQTATRSYTISVQGNASGIAFPEYQTLSIEADGNATVGIEYRSPSKPGYYGGTLVVHVGGVPIGSLQIRIVVPTPEPPPEAGVRILSSSAFVDLEWNYRVVGEVLNEASRTTRRITVTATFFDDERKMVVASDKSTQGSWCVEPGKKAPFDLTARMGSSRSGFWVTRYTLEVSWDTAPSQPLVVVGSTSYVDGQGELHVQGEISNRNANTAAWSSIVATFYNETGSVVATASCQTLVFYVGSGKESPFTMVLEGRDKGRVSLVRNYSLTAYCNSWHEEPYSEILGIRVLNSSSFTGDNGSFHILGEVANITSSAVIWGMTGRIATRIVASLYDEQSCVVGTTTFGVDASGSPGTRPFHLVFEDTEYIPPIQGYRLLLDVRAYFPEDFAAMASLLIGLMLLAFSLLGGTPIARVAAAGSSQPR